MQRTLSLLLLLAASGMLASCYGPEPRPFASGRGRSLDQPPRYGDTNRYVDPVPTAPMDQPAGPQVPQPSLDPSGTPALDQGLTLTPPAPNPGVPGGMTTPPSPADSTAVVPPPAPTPTPTPAPTPPAAGDVPYARAVPGKPGFVYSPNDPKKIISVEGLRPGQKARDPETGDIFRVPY